MSADSTIRLYVVRGWSLIENRFVCRVFRAYTAADALTQWSIEAPEAKQRDAHSVEPIEEGDPRLGKRAIRDLGSFGSIHATCRRRRGTSEPWATRDGILSRAARIRTAPRRARRPLACTAAGDASPAVARAPRG